MTVIAAIGSGAGASHVLRVATAVAKALGTDVEALHAGRRGMREAGEHAVAAGVPLGLLPSPAAPALVAVMRERKIAAVILGRPAMIGGHFPVRSVAGRVVTAAEKPVVVVPHDTPGDYRLRRVLVPVKADPSASTSLRATITVTEDADLEFVVLHVRDEGSFPRFDDQPHYEVETWAREFLHRWVDVPVLRVAMQVRMGNPADQVVRCAGEVGADLIALGWGQDFRSGAKVVRAVLARSSIPVALLPLGGEGRPPGRGRGPAEA